MKTTEVIEKLQHLVDKNGDYEFNLYKKSEDVDVKGELTFFADESAKDICIGFDN